MGTINRVFLVGHTGKDAKVSATQSGGTVVSFPMATDRNRKVDGEWQSTPEWHTVVVYGEATESAGKIAKGALVGVEGRLQRNESKDAFDPYFIVATKVTVLKRANGVSSDASESAVSSQPNDGLENLPF